MQNILSKQAMTLTHFFFFFFLLLRVSTAAVIIPSSNSGTPLKFPALLIFGDSTVDTGNNNYIATALKADHYPYGKDFSTAHVATGRFSNGKLIPDFLVSMLGINGTVPPFLQPNLSDDDLRTGVNFASAGSGYDDRTAAISKVVPVSRQPQYLKGYIERLKTVVGDEEAERIVGGALVVVSAGTNDFVFNAYGGGIGTRKADYFSVDAYQDFILTTLHNFVMELYDLGCRTIVVAGLPPIGCLPIQITASFNNSNPRTCLEDQNSDSQSYNKKLVKLLPRIQSSLPGSKILYADCYKPLADMINHPEKHGLVETKRGCCGTGLIEAGPICTAISPVCPDASKYLFFDSIHPTESAYNYITNLLTDEISSKLAQPV